MPRRLAYRSTSLPIWIAFALALLLFAVALALTWWRIGSSYDGAVVRSETAAPPTGVVALR